MKNLLLLLTVAVLFSCGGGWSEEDQQAFLYECPDRPEKCDCYLKASEKKFDDYAAFKDSWGKDEHEEWSEEVEEACMGA